MMSFLRSSESFFVSRFSSYVKVFDTATTRQQDNSSNRLNQDSQDYRINGIDTPTPRHHDNKDNHDNNYNFPHMHTSTQNKFKVESLKLKVGTDTPTPRHRDNFSIISHLSTFLTIFLLLITTTGWGQTNYYYKGSGNVTSPSSWSSTTDLTGASPANFSANNCIYNLRNASSISLDASWNVGGTSSKIIVGDGSNACNFTVGSNFVVTAPATDVNDKGTITRTSSAVQSWGTLNVLGGGTYDHNFATGSLPTATWNSASTLLISANLQSNGFNGVTFGNVTFRNTAGTTMFTSSANQSATIAGNLNLQGTGTIIMSSQATGWNATLTVNGSVNISGNSTFRIESVSASGTNTKTLLVLGNYDQSNGTMDLATNTSTAITAGSRTMILEVRGNFTHSGGTITENASDGHMTTRILLSGTTGTQTLESTGQTTSGATDGSGTIDFNVAGSNAQCVISATKTFILSSTSSFTVGTGTSSPDLSISGTFVNSGSSIGTTAITGTWAVNNGGNYVHNTTAAISTPLDRCTLNTGSTITYRGSGAPLMPAMSLGSGRTYQNLAFESSSGTWTATANATTALIINGNLTVGSGVTFNFSNTGTPGNSIKGNISVAGTLNFSPALAGTVNLNGSSTQTISGAGTITTGANSTLLVGASSTIDFGASSTIAGSGTFTTVSGSTLITANTLGINGSLTLSTRSLDAGTNYTFNNSVPSAQVTGAAVTATNNLTVNNSAGLTLSANTAVTGTLTLSNGVLTTNGKTLTLSNSATGSNSSYILADATGTVTMNAVTTAKTIPIGTSTAYAPLTVTAGSSTNYTAYVTGTTTWPGSCTPATSSQMVNLAWGLSGSNAPSQVVFQWPAGSQAGSFTPGSSCDLGRYNATCPYNVTNIGAASGSGPYTLTCTSGLGTTNNIYVIGNQNSIVVVAPTPTITGAATATAFTTTYGTASAAQSFSVSGSNLTANLVATAQTGFEVATAENGTYQSSVTFTQSSGSASGTVWVRLKSDAAVNGTYNNVIAVELTSTDATTRNITTAATGNAVSKATPNITTPPTVSDINQGQSLASSNFLTGAANVAGSFGWTNSSITPSVGTSSQSYTFTPTDGTNYNTVTGSVNVTVNASTVPTITTSGTLSALTTSYGTPSSTTSFTVSGSALTNNILISAPSGFEMSSGGAYSSSLTLTQSSGSVASTTINVRLAQTASVAGSPYSGNIVVSSDGAASVNVATASSTVSKATLTITANNQTSVAYGTAVATVTGAGSNTATGFFNGDNSSVISGTVSYTTNYTTTTAVGAASITITPNVSSLTATNYSFSAANGTITVVAATPGAPNITGITPGNGSLSVAFSAGSTGGVSLSNYEYSLNGGAWVARSPSATTTPISISGLTNGTSYAVKIRAVNSAGSGAESNEVSATPYASVYYLKSGGSISNLNDWGTNTAGTSGGPAPAITSSSITWNINNSDATLDAAWALGSGSKVVVGDGTTGRTLTIPSSFALTGTVDVAASSTLAIANTTIPTFGTLATNSTINYAASSGTQNITATTYSNLTLSGGGTKAFPSGTVTIAGTFTPGSGFSASQGTINFSSSSSQTIPAFNYFNITNTGNGPRTLANSGTVGIAGQTFSPGSGTYTVTGSTVDYNGTIGSGNTTTYSAFTYNNLTISGDKGGGTINLGTGTITIQGSFSYTATNVTQVAGSGTITMSSASSQTVPAINYNNLNLTGGARDLGNGTIKIAGTLTPGDGPYTIGTSKVDFNSSSGGQTIPVLPVTSGPNYYNLTYSGTSTGATIGGTMTVGNNLEVSGSQALAITNGTARTLTVNGNVFVLNTGRLNLAASGSTVAGTLDLKGNLTYTSTNSSSSTTVASITNGTIVFSGAGTIASPQIFDLADNNDFTFTNYTINSGTVVRFANSLILSGSSQISNPDYRGTFILNGTLDLQGNTITSSASNAIFTINSGGTLITSNSGGINSAISSSNITRTFTAGANYVFNGATTTGFPSSAQQSTFGNPANVDINAAVTLNRAISMSGTLTLGAILTTSSTNTLTLTNNSISAVSGAGSGKYVSGPLSWTLPTGLSASSSIYTFPLGKSGTYYPVSLSTITTGGTAPVVTFEAFAASTGGTASTGLSSISTTEYWSGSSTGSFTSASLSFDRNSTLGSLNDIGTASTLTGNYTSIGGGASGTAINNTNVVSSLGFFVMGVEATSPIIYVNGAAANASATAFSTTYGTASGVQTFTITGSVLTNNITATAPSGFEVSSDGSTYASTATFTQTSGSASGTLRVRLAAAATVSGTYNSVNIVLSSNSATNRNIATTSTGNQVTAKGLTISGVSISNKEYDGNPTATISGTITYSGLVNGETFSVTGTPTATFNNKNVATGKTVTVSGYTAPSTNYSITQPSGFTANITPKALTVSGVAVTTKQYDGTNAATITGSLSGVISPDVVNLSATGTFASVNVGTGIAVTSTASLTGADAGNYSLTQPTGLTGNIIKADQTITGLASTDVKYTSTSTYSLTATASSGLTVSYTSSNPAVATVSGNTVTIIGVGQTTITASQAGNANYNAASDVTQTLTISTNPVITLTPSSLAAFSATSGTASTAQAVTVAGSDLSANITVTAPTGYEVSQTSETAGFASSQTLTQSAGSYSGTVYVRLTSSAASGSNTGNLSFATTSATTQNIALTGTVYSNTIANWTFQTNRTTASGTTSGNVSPEIGSGTFRGVHASSSTIFGPTTGNGSGTTSAQSATNWALGDFWEMRISTTNFSAINLEWDQTSSGTGPRDFKIEYSTNGTTYTNVPSTVSNYQYALTAEAWNSTTYNSASTRSINLSSISAINNQSDTYIRLTVNSSTNINGTAIAGNGTSRIDNIKFTGTPFYLISGGGPLASLTTTYGTLSASSTSFTIAGTGLSNTISLSAPSGFVLSTSSNGTYTSTLSGISATGPTTIFVKLSPTAAVGTYSGNISCTSGSASLNVPLPASTVTKAALSITANDDTKTYGQTKTYGAGSTAFTSSGLQNNETIGSVTITASGGTASNDAVGTYTLTPSAATGGTFTEGNYSITYNTGTLTVNKANSSITATGTTIYTYNGSAQGPNTSDVTGSTGTVTYSYTGIAPTSYGPSATAPTNAGTYLVVATVAADANYNGASSDPLAFTINKANSSITATGTTSYTYNGSAQGPASADVTGSTGAVTYSYSGTGSTSYGSSATRPSNAGTYEVVATVAADANYNGASSDPLAFTINQAPITIKANNASKCAGSSLSFNGTEFTISSGSLVSGDEVSSVSLSSTGAASTAANNTYPIVPSAAQGTGLSNYSISYSNGTLTVANCFTVTYNSNGSTSGTIPSSQNSISGSTITVASNSGNLFKDGFTFAGWNTQAGGLGTNYTAGSGTFTLTSNITLYARWISNGVISQAPGAKFWIAGTGNWTDGNNWLPAGAPVSGTDNVYIENGSPVMNESFIVGGGRNLTLTGTGSLTINPNVVLTIAGDADFGGRPVILKSTSAGTAAIGEVSGTLDGASSVTVERYLSGKRKWRALTSPVTGINNNTIFNNWQNNGTPSGATGAIMWTPAPNTMSESGLYTSGTGTSTSILRFNNGGNGWLPVTNTKSEELFNNSTNKAYMLFFTGPYNIGGTYITSGTAASTLSATGTLRTGTIPFNNLATGWHMIGNPYASPVKITTSGVSGLNEAGGYIWSANAGSGVGIYLPAPYGSTTLQSGQAYFVYSDANGGSLTFREEDKVGTSINNAVYRTEEGLSGGDVQIELNKYNNGTLELFDAAICNYKSRSEKGLPKLAQFYENMSIYENNVDYGMSTRVMKNGEDMIQLRMWQMKEAAYQLNIDLRGMSMPAGSVAVLQDAFLNQETVLSVTEANKVDFSVDANAASSGQRFRIVLRRAENTIVTEAPQPFQVYPNPVVKGTVMQLEFKNRPAGKFTVTLFTITGVRVQQDIVAHAGGTAMQSLKLSTQLASGTYIAEIMGANGVSEKVKVVIE